MTTLTKKEIFRLGIVTLAIDHNPKKKGTMSYDRFQGYFTFDWAAVAEGNAEVTVQDCFDAGLRMDDIRHDSEHGFITIEPFAVEAPMAAEEVAAD